MISEKSHDKFKSLCQRTIVDFKSLFHEWLVSIACNPCRETEFKVSSFCLLVLIASILVIWSDLKTLMLSILLRWIHRYHIDFYFCNKHNRPQRSSTKKHRVGYRRDLPINQGSALNFSMCTYLSFLSFTDLVSLVVEFVFTLLRGKCDSRKESNEPCTKELWISINFLISIFNVFKGKQIWRNPNIPSRINTFNPYS